MGARPSDDAGGGGAETDDWADAVTIAYDSNGRLATVKTLKRGTSPAPDTVLNAVGFHYSALGLPEHFDQNPLGDLTYSGTTPTGTTKRVGSTYDLKKMPDGNWVRANGVVYPSGQSLDIGYGTGGTSDRISRPQSLGFHAATAAVEYQFLGAATPVIASYPAPGIRLDRSMAQSGAQSDGQYPCMDAFGRVTRQLWIDSGYAPGSISGFANRPALVDTTYAYTRLSGLTSKLDARPGATMLAQHAYTLDGLLRLLADQRGTASFPSSQAKPGSQDFSYDFIGNLPSMRTDTSSAGTFSSGTTDASTSTFNMVNEIAAGSFVPLGGTPQSIGFAWDHGGNLSSRGIAGAAGYGWTYKHDRWGRLTQVDFTAGSTPQPALRAQYTGLGMRCVVDRAPDSWVPPAAPTVSQRRLGYFDLGWQLLEEQIDDDLPLATSGAESDIDQVEQLVWGMRHVDDLVLRRVNSNYAGGADTDFSDAGDRAGDQFLGDLQFSVVAAVDSAGALLERVEYDAYGQAQHHWPEGITGAPGGGVVAADSTAASGAVGKSIGQTGYLADADLDRSGTVTAAEASAVAAKVGTAGIPAGRISAYGNTVGWCGYRFNAGPDLLTVRFRHYDPAPGVARWLERDPAGYMDGASLYQYVTMQPTSGSDPVGLWGIQFGSLLIGSGNPWLAFTNKSWGHLAEGAMATADGIVPFGDPFADLGAYQADTWDVQASQQLGELSRNLALAALGLHGVNLGAWRVWIQNPLKYELGSATVGSYEAMMAEIGEGATAFQKYDWLRANGKFFDMVFGFRWVRNLGSGATPGGAIALGLPLAVQAWRFLFGSSSGAPLAGGRRLGVVAARNTGAASAGAQSNILATVVPLLIRYISQYPLGPQITCPK
ncbi:MAG: RHS repeat-associated core domain-containing protein [Phycisphaerales bacterium]